MTLLILEEVIGDLLLGIDFLEQCNATLQCGGITARMHRKKRNKNRTRKSHGIGSLATGDLTDAEIQETLKKELDMMSQIKGVSHIATHKIFMKHDRPIKQSSPVVIVEKKNKEWRLCIDYRQLNEHSERDAYPVPRMDHILNQLREAKSSWLQEANPGCSGRQTSASQETNSYTNHGNNTANDGDTNNQGNDHGNNTANGNNSNNQENDHGNNTANDGDTNNQGNDHGNNTANGNNSNNQKNDHGNKTTTDDNNNNQGNDTANNGQRSTTPHAQDNNRNKKERAG
ncbi:putative uncharacterized protein DDB_G0286901 [Drosophila rhopaloa]|uniref:Uncharacterized protein n=1 Tax=Drosophila rhopaloa TaxID=1041015 RepID=A0ABM5J8N4_DRORH|nr:putative uncharacterized protein DDB_G0286901 [Drosophila rhopaloa]